VLAFRANAGDLGVTHATNSFELPSLNLLVQLFDKGLVSLDGGAIGKVMPASKALTIVNCGAQRVDQGMAFSRELFARSDPDYLWTAHELFASAARAAFSKRSRSFCPS